jgi:hypothetical protein
MLLPSQHLTISFVYEYRRDRRLIPYNNNYPSSYRDLEDDTLGVPVDLRLNYKSRKGVYLWSRLLLGGHDANSRSLNMR